MDVMGDRLKKLIKVLGLTQKSFGESIGIKPAYVSDLINERAKGFSTESLIRIQQVHNVNLNWLLTGQGSMFLDEGPAKESAVKEHGNGFREIQGNAQSWPEVDEIEKVSRTGWWKNLDENSRVTYAINETLPGEAKQRLRDAAEYEYRIHKQRLEKEKDTTLHEKGETG